MSRRQQPQGTQVSLFPFLTVLLCAMGALIFLFLVITQQIRTDTLAAQQVVVEEPEPTVEPVIEEIEEVKEAESPVAEEPAPPVAVVKPEPVEPIDPNIPWRTRLSQLKQNREIRQQQQRQLQDQTQKIKQQLVTYKKQANQTLAEQAQLEAQLKEEQERAKEIESEAEELESLGVELEKQIERKQTDVRTAQSEFAIIPYDGQMGTVRRPILIECEEDSITFQPEGIALTAEDVRGFTSHDNPLAAGAQALIEFWEEEDRRAGREVTEPYLLMVVRPSGSVSFYAAQKMLSSLKVQSGYELLPESYPVKWPAPNEEATSRCRAAVEGALKNKPSKQAMRLADLQANNKHLSADEFRNRHRDSGGHGSLGAANTPSEPPARQMRFDPNIGRFIEMTPAPRRTKSHWEELDARVSKLGSPSGNSREERSGSPGSGYANTAEELKNPASSGNSLESQSPTNNGGGSGETELKPASPLMNLDEQQSELARQRRSPEPAELENGLENNGFANNGFENREFENNGFGQNGSGDSDPEMKSIREIDPRSGLNGQGERSADLEEQYTRSFSDSKRPTLSDSTQQRISSRPSSQMGSPGLSNQTAPWFQDSNNSSSAPPTDAQGQSSMFGSPQQQGEGGEPSRFEMPRRMRMQQKLEVIIDGEKIRIAGGQPIDVDINRDDLEIAEEFKQQIGEIVSTWSRLPSGFYWTPYLEFVVLPGGTVTLERLLLQLPTKEVDYETEFELERPAPFQIEKPLLNESVEEILLLQGAD
ncbi:hypothetical protein Pla110_10570 [Polystyrenella longa]|uniref:IncA protein n=1 Tax=Polystyrenella longa TaxID=2528007 RepID=A0A518CJD8_9PLAN|nr:hypothetical protein [Polystyrenella longa]QDU79349.1 hypothetical protein Pla110_10570 [Polystyrenella longa]